jgi:hypothetical protein
MRRAATVLGSLAAAGVLALSLSGSAWAASGTLIINGRAYNNPSGCYNSDRWPLSVANHTDAPAVISEGQGCSGEQLDTVFPGDSTVSEFGGSVYID